MTGSDLARREFRITTDRTAASLLFNPWMETSFALIIYYCMVPLGSPEKITDLVTEIYHLEAGQAFF